MKRTIRLLPILLAIIMLFSFLAGCGQTTTTPPEATVTEIRVSTLPETQYTVGQAFDLSGGKLELTYSDDSVRYIDLNNTDVHVSDPDMSVPGNKTVTVEYDGFEDTFLITVAQQTFTVTFNPNYTGATNTTATVTKGDTVTAASTPVREGYRFEGWYTENGSAPFDFAETTIASNLTLFAHWTQLLAVTFDLNYENAPAAKTVSVDYNEKVQSASAPAAVREGFLFEGWFTQKTGGTAFSFDTVLTSDTVLYAHWNAIAADDIVYTVTINYNNSGLANGSEQVLEGAKLARPADPKAQGRVFEGWFVDEALTNEYNFDTPVTGNFTLYAKWRVTYYTVTFKYSVDGQETVHSTRQVAPGGAFPTVTAPKVTGYYFVQNRWYTDETLATVCTVTAVNDDLVVYGKPLKSNLFEAEFTYIDEAKPGQGSSNNMSGLDIIDLDHGTAEASNRYYVSNLYYNGAFIEFVIVAEEATDDAVLQLRLSSEWEDMYLAPKDMVYEGTNYYGFVVSSAPALMDENGAVRKDNKGYVLYNSEDVIAYDYTPIALPGAIPFDESMYDKRPFENFLITTDLHLVKGVNVIRLTVNNTHDHDATMDSDAPMIDCMYIYTDVTLTWTPYTHNTDNITE